MPIRIVLAGWEQDGRPEIPAHVAQEMRAFGCRGLSAALERALAEGRALVLFDGLDETRDPDATARTIGQLAAGWHPQVRVVVASRYQGHRRPSDDFQELTLCLLDAGGQQDLIARRLGRGTKRAGALWARIQGDVRLQDLAGLPLLLTMMCLVEDKPTPAEAAVWGPRAQLYARLIDRFLQGQPTDRRENVRAMRSRVDAEDALRALSLDLLTRGGEAWSLEQVTVPLRRRLHWWSGPDDFLREVEQVTGLLFPIDDARRTYHFLHRSVQEYLAAWALRRAGGAAWRAHTPALAAEGSRWVEVFILLSEMTPAAETGPLIAALTARRPSAVVRALEGCRRRDGRPGAPPKDALIAALRGSHPTPDTQSAAIDARAAYLASLPERLGEAEAVEVFAALLPDAPAIEQGMVGWVLSGLEGPEARGLWARERFFAAARRPLVAPEALGETWAPSPAGASRWARRRASGSTRSGHSTQWRSRAFR